MNRRWRPGHVAPRASRGKRLLLLGVVALILGGLGWLYGGRFLAIHHLASEVAILKGNHEALLREIQTLRTQLAQLDDPQVVEAQAREILGWGFPDEQLLVIERR